VSISHYDGSVWGGNLMSGVRFGTQYSARSVTAVRRRGAGVSLTVSTDDPSGRTLTVDVGAAVLLPLRHENVALIVS
jgi:hypothetical protein